MVAVERYARALKVARVSEECFTRGGQADTVYRITFTSNNPTEDERRLCTLICGHDS
jgi:hypothetical protein